MKFHKDGTIPEINEKTIFVFGSNLAGRHGAGAAKVAMQKFGAKYGEGLHLVGNAYPIPTKDESLRTLPIKRIKSYIRVFEVYSKCNTDFNFFVTRIGCGLAGYRDEDIAPLFRFATDDRYSFAEEWKPFLMLPEHDV